MSTANTAFVKSAGVEFSGQKLHPLTPQRAAIAAEMGMRWPNIGKRDRYTVDIEIADEKGKKRKIEVVHYKQSFKDSVFAMWLCSQGEDAIDDAERDPDQARKDAWAWAKELGLTPNSALAPQALFAWITIINQAAQSQGVPINKHPEFAPEDDSGEL